MRHEEAVIKIIYQIIILALLGLTGYVSGKSNYLPKKSGEILSGIVVKLTAPLLIVTTMADYSFDKSILNNGLFIYLGGLLFMLFSYFIGVFLLKWIKLDSAAGNIFRMHCMFGNVLFLAFPLISSVYGQSGIIYAMFFNLANDTLLWTLGIYLVNRHKSIEWKKNLKHLVNGNTIAFSLGLIFMVIDLKGIVGRSGPVVKDVYNLLFNTFNPLGKTTIYLSMVFIGLILSQARINSVSDLLKRCPILMLSVQKLVLVPVAALAILNLLELAFSSFIGWNIEPLAKAIIVLQLAMPCGTIVPALAAQHGADYKFATESVFVSTLMSAATLPLMLNILLVFG